MIICCGEALIDFLPRTLLDGEMAYQPLCGGSLYNTAIALGRLSVPVGLYTGLSYDFFGEMIKKSLSESKVSLDFTRFFERPSILAFVKFEQEHARYCFFDENSAAHMLAKEPMPEFSDHVKALHFGSLSLIGAPVGDLYETLLRDQSQKRLICLDPNIRPSQIRDRAHHLARLNRLIALSDIVKVSQEDIDWIVGKDSRAVGGTPERGVKTNQAVGGTPEREEPRAVGGTPERGVKTTSRAVEQSPERGVKKERWTPEEWLSAGAKLVIITKGSQGIEAYGAGGFVHKVPAYPIKLVDTVGAGDSFTAGFLGFLHKAGGLDKAAFKNLDSEIIREALDFAVRVAAVNCSRAGANPPWLHEMQESKGEFFPG